MVMDVNVFDVLLLVFVGLLVLRGLLSGLTRLLIGTGALVAAFMLAAQFHGPVAASLVQFLEMSEPAAELAAYAVIFLGTMLAGSLVASRLGRGLKTKTIFSWVTVSASASTTWALVTTNPSGVMTKPLPVPPVWTGP